MVALGLLFLSGEALRAETADERDASLDERPTAGGRAAWVLSDDLDLVGDVWADLPLVAGPRDALFFALDTRVTIEKTTDDFAFQLGHLEYDMELGWRSRREWLGLRPFYFFLGQRGKERIDDEGDAAVGYLGIGAESKCFRLYSAGPSCPPDGCSAASRLEWRVRGGPVVGERSVRADAVLRGEARFWLSPPNSRRLSFGLEASLDGLLDDSHFDADVAGGPRLAIRLAGQRSASFFLHYLRSRNPLGLGEDAWMLGFAYEEGLGAGRPSPPEIGGRVGAGGGEGRDAGRFLLRVLSPEFAGNSRVVFLADGNVLSGDDTDEIYYLYHLGVERPIARLGIGGIYFYHRSNHQLAKPNDRITSINVLEAGLATDDWNRVGRREIGDRSPFAASARVGVLLDSTFGEDRFWHARGGVRWTPFPRSRGPSPYLLVDLESGDVERETFGVGLALARQLDLQVEHRSDDQYFGRDRTAWLAMAYYGF